MDPYAQVIAGLSYFKRGERVRGKAAWERALALAPNDSSVLRNVGVNMAYGMGTERAAEGVELIKRAWRLNPLAPAWTMDTLGYASYFAGQYEQAIEALEQERRSQPGAKGRLRRSPMPSSGARSMRRARSR